MSSFLKMSRGCLSVGTVGYSRSTLYAKSRATSILTFLRYSAEEHVVSAEALLEAQYHDGNAPKTHIETKHHCSRTAPQGQSNPSANDGIGDPTQKRARAEK